MNTPIRVLQICQRMEAAGVQSFIMNMYRNIDRSKVQFDFLVHYKEEQFYDDEIRRLGGRIYKLSVREDYNVLNYIRQLDSFFAKHKEYSIVHGHMDTLGCIYLGMAKKAGVPYRIAHAHNDSIQSGIKKWPRLYMISQYKKNANILCACSINAGQFMFGNDSYKVWNNAIDTTRFRYDPIIRKKKRIELSIGDEEVVFGNVGRFHVQKNQLFLIDIFSEAVKQNDRCKLLLIGDGELENAITKKINELNLEKNVLILSNRHDVNELYQVMDVFVLPSLYEGLPVSGIEAQASGLPCVFSDTITRNVNISENCYFYSLNDSPQKWAAKILSLIKDHKRTDVTERIVKAGYDAYTESRKLQRFYLALNKGDKH